MTVGKRIKAVRKFLNMTAIEFAKIFNMSQANLSGIENDAQNPKLTMLEEIYKRWNINATWLLSGEGEMLMSNTQNITSNETNDNTINVTLLTRIVYEVELALRNIGLDLEPKGKAKIIAAFYDEYIKEMQNNTDISDIYTSMNKNINTVIKLQKKI